MKKYPNLTIASRNKNSLTAAVKLSSFLLAITLSHSSYADVSPIDCTTLSVKEISQKLVTKKLTSEQCVRQFLDKIAELDPEIIPPRDPNASGLLPRGVDGQGYVDWIDSFAGVNHFIFINPNAIAQAPAADAARAAGDTRPLLGVPFATKENAPIILGGVRFPQFNGSSAFTRPPLGDGFSTSLSPYASRLYNDLGMINLGLTNRSELGNDSNGIAFVTGASRNAYDPERISGGSTAGGAPAIAAFETASSDGTDLGGSVRTPPSLNGIVGFRPTVNLVFPANLSPTCNLSYTGGTNGVNATVGRLNDRYLTTTNLLNPDAMTAQGMMSRNIEDLILLDSQVAVNGLGPVVDRYDLRGLRLLVPADYYADLEPAVKAVIDKSLKKLEKHGATLVRVPTIPGINPGVDVSSDPLLSGLDPSTGKLLTYQDVFSKTAIATRASAGYSFLEEPLGLGTDGPATFHAMAFFRQAFPPPGALRANYANFYNRCVIPLRKQIIENYITYMAVNHIDAVIFPTVKIEPPRINDILRGPDPRTLPFDPNQIPDWILPGSTRGQTVTARIAENMLFSPLTGSPELTLPAGLTKPNRLPVGLSLQGVPGSDLHMMSIGKAIQKFIHIKSPNVSKLSKFVNHETIENEDAYMDGDGDGDDDD